MKVSAVTVLYNPDENVIKNIETYINYVEKIFLIDNSEIPNEIISQYFKNNSNVYYISHKENKGIAKALNEGIDKAASLNFDYVLTMDQDSFFEESLIKKYLEEFKELNQKSSISVVGPSYENVIIYDENITEVNTLITSGSIINIDVYNKAGKYNEWLFIDQVDNDFCFRAKLLGYKVLRFNHIFLNHKLGTSKKINSKRNVVLHSSFRLYFIVRNSLYIIKKYKKDFPEEIKEIKMDVLVRIKNNLFYGSSKFKTLKNIIKGFLDYKRNNFGNKLNS